MERRKPFLRQRRSRREDAGQAEGRTQIQLAKAERTQIWEGIGRISLGGRRSERSSLGECRSGGVASDPALDDSDLRRYW